MPVCPHIMICFPEEYDNAKAYNFCSQARKSSHLLHTEAKNFDEYAWGYSTFLILLKLLIGKWTFVQLEFQAI